MMQLIKVFLYLVVFFQPFCLQAQGLWANVGGGYPCNVSSRVLHKQCYVGEVFEILVPFDDWNFIHFYNAFTPSLTDDSSLLLLNQEGNCLRFKAVKPGKSFFCTISKNAEEWRSPVWGRLITQYFEDDYIVEVVDRPTKNTQVSAWEIKKGNDFYVGTQVLHLQCVVGEEFEVPFNSRSQKFINANNHFDGPKDPVIFPYIGSDLGCATTQNENMMVTKQDWYTLTFKALKPGVASFCLIEKSFSCSTLFSLHCEYAYCPNQDLWLNECVYLIEIVEPSQEQLSAFVIMTNS